MFIIFNLSIVQISITIFKYYYSNLNYKQLFLIIKKSFLLLFII